MTTETTPGSRRSADEDPTGRVHRFVHDLTTDDSVAVSIVRAVAAVAGVDPTSLQPRLYDVLDPDALEKLVGSRATAGGAPVRVTFDLADYRVTVVRDRQILVEAFDAPRSVGDLA